MSEAVERAYAIAMSTEQVSLNEALKARSGETVPVRATDLMAALTELDVAVFYRTTAEAERDALLVLLEEAGRVLRNTTEGVEAALSMVEQQGYIPDWDWLRGLRHDARSLLSRLNEDKPT